ncbi:MAG: NAD-dependent epimerase/dehydratase family protein [Chloroflexota bacterium]
MAEQKSYLITGGAGFLGINLTRYLLARGHKVASIDFADYTYPERDRVTVYQDDIRDRPAVDRAMEGIDIVVHTAAALPLYSEADIMSTDVEGTRNILDSAQKHGVERVIQISSTAVYGVPDHHPLYETDKLIGVGPYGKAKIMAEEVCESFRATGLCVPVIRPKSFIGPERLGVFALFYDWAKDGHGFPMIGSGKNRYQLLDVDDLCDAIYLCATLDRDAVNQTFNIGAKAFTTMREDYQAVLDTAGFHKQIRPLPEAPAILALKILWALKLSPLYGWVFETAGKDSFVSIEKAENVLGYAPKYSNQDALIRNYRWYLDNMKHFEGQSGVSHRVPWSQGVLKLAKVFF